MLILVPVGLKVGQLLTNFLQKNALKNIFEKENIKYFSEKDVEIYSRILT